MSNNLDLTQLASNQNNKEVTINDQSAQLDAALTDLAEVSISGETSPLSLTDADSLRRMTLRFSGAPSGDSVAITNASFEADGTTSPGDPITGWTLDSGDWRVDDVDGALSAQDGTYFLAGTDNQTDGVLRQDVDLVAAGLTTGELDGGTLSLALSFWRANTAPDDTGRVVAEFLDSGLSVIGTLGDTGDEEITPEDTWVERSFANPIPIGTRHLRIRCIVTFVTGTVTNTTFDNFQLSSVEAPFDVEVPDNPKLYVIDNDAGLSLLIRTALGTGVTVVDGRRRWVYCDGTNVIDLGGTSVGDNPVKQAVRVATDAAGTLSSTFQDSDTVDGVTLATGDRILIKDQGDASENGIYTVNASGAPTRATDFDQSVELTRGLLVAVIEGTANSNSLWMLTTAGPYTVGSTDLTFAQVSGGGGGSITELDDVGDVNVTYRDDHDMLVWDATAMEWVNLNISYELGLFVGGTPGDNERLFLHVFTRDVEFPENLSTSEGYAAVAPAEDDEWEIRKNGSPIGTVNFDAPYNEVTFTLAGGASFVDGDRLEIVADYPSDDTLADVALTIRGIRKS